MLSMMKSAFYFVGDFHTSSVEVYDYFKDYRGMVGRILSVAEIDQEDPEMKCVIIFSDPRLALEFFKSEKLPLNSFYALISEREGKYKEEALKKFESFSLKFYTPKKVTRLIEEVDQFLLGNSINCEDIEFSVQLALGKD